MSDILDARSLDILVMIPIPFQIESKTLFSSSISIQINYSMTHNSDLPTCHRTDDDKTQDQEQNKDGFYNNILYDNPFLGLPLNLASIKLLGFSSKSSHLLLTAKVHANKLNIFQNCKISYQYLESV